MTTKTSYKFLSLAEEDELNPRYCIVCGTRLGLYQRNRVCGSACFNAATKK